MFVANLAHLNALDYNVQSMQCKLKGSAVSLSVMRESKQVI